MGAFCSRTGQARCRIGDSSVGALLLRPPRSSKSSHVIALAGDADNQALVPEGRERASRGAVRDLVLLGEGQDGRNPARQLSSLNLATQDRRELLVQRNR